MKQKLYTKSYDINLLKEINNHGGQFTAEEHAYVIEKEFGDTFYKTKEGFLQHYLQNNWYKLSSLEFLIKQTIDNQYKNILSLGSGCCVIEYLLKLSLPRDTTVIASDFDAYLIKKAKLFFPEIIPVIFDFFKDDIKSLKDRLNLRFDIAIFLGSAYVMDDKQFVNLLRRLKDSGVKEIIDFQAGYMGIIGIIYYLLSPLRRNYIVRRLFGKPPINESDYIGKFHGYSRSRNELKYLYRKSGLKIVKEITVGSYKYVAILR